MYLYRRRVNNCGVARVGVSLSKKCLICAVFCYRINDKFKQNIKATWNILIVLAKKGGKKKKRDKVIFFEKRKKKETAQVNGQRFAEKKSSFLDAKQLCGINHAQHAALVREARGRGALFRCRVVHNDQR